MTNQELKNKVEYWPIIIGLLIYCFLCTVTLFTFSHHFVNAQITPKWLGMMMTIGLIGIAGSVSNCKIKIPPYPYLFGTVLAFTLVLAFQGLLQFLRLLSGTHNFTVSGNFDNPAGFASALAGTFPLCFFFFTNSKEYYRCAAILGAIIITIAVILSGSRAGISAITITIVVWLVLKSKIKKQRLKIVTILVVFSLLLVLYFFKKDSADGRLLIWRCTLDMIADKPILGHGPGAFQAKYMLYQAAYFNKNPECKFAQLADNTLHPFNEYLGVLSEFGLIGFAVLVLFIYLVVRTFLRNRNEEKSAAMMSLLALAIFSFFSYPFRYPFTWVLLFLNLTVIFDLEIKRLMCFASVGQKSIIKKYLPRIAVFLLSCAMTVYILMLAKAEIKWKNITHQLLERKTEKILSEYDKLYFLLGKNGLFLYNHAAELYEAKNYEKSIAVAELCTRYFNDKDVQMLIANNYRELGKPAEAEKHLKIAAAMCPASFIPLYELAKLFIATEHKDEAVAMAKKILTKKIKLTSPIVKAIKKEMQKLIRVEEITDQQESVDLNIKQSKNKNIRQGEAPSIKSASAALPP